MHQNNLELVEQFFSELRSAATGDFGEDEKIRFIELFMSRVQTKPLNIDQGGEFSRYPLSGISSKPEFHPTLSTLLCANEPNKRFLAYLTVGCSEYRACQEDLVIAMQRDPDEVSRMWAGIALMFLNHENTSALFDFVVENDTKFDGRLTAFYLYYLEKSAIREIALDRIDSSNLTEKILAVRSISFAGPHIDSEAVLRKAIQEWDTPIKLHAIEALGSLTSDPLKELLAPFLNQPELRQSCLMVLANSNDESDRAYFQTLVPDIGLISDDILDSLLKSKDRDHLRKWLNIVSSREIPKDYDFSIVEQPLLKDDSLQKDVIKAIQTIKNRKLLSELVRALAGRRDEASANLLKALLLDEDPTVRFWAQQSLE